MLSSTSTKLSLTALLAFGVVTSVGCSKERRNDGGIIKPKDAGTGDTGVEDSGNPPLDSGMNENDAGNNGNDAGNNNNDAGNNNDSGVPPDGGMQMAECAVNTDCAGAGTQFCLDFDNTSGSLVQCTGANTCQCWQGCDSFVGVDQSGCARPAEACANAGGMSPTPGVCIPDMGGGTQGEACTTQWAGTDPTMAPTADSCNGAQNFICHGSDPLDITGTCVRLCDTANGALCTALDAQSQCMPFAPTTTRGICTRPITDIGTACTDPTMCQGGACSAELGGQCSEACGVSFVCPEANGLCVFVDGQLSPICALECTLGTAGDTMCSGVNPDLICEDLGVALCFPRCTQDPDCAPGTCDVGTGHCQ